METKKKRRLLLLHILMLCGLLFLAVEFAEEIQTAKKAVYYMIHPKREPGDRDAEIVLYPVENSGDEWFADYPLIHHAGGGIEGNTYTNSVEALENTLRKYPDKCVVEIDFLRTSDGELVCCHGWEESFLEKEQPTLEEFLSRKVQGRYTPMTAQRMLEIMKENPQMYLVTDVKDDKNLTEIISQLAELCGWDESVLDRFIIQLYTGREKTAIQKIYPFEDSQFVFTTYKWGIWEHEAAQICNEENVSVIAVPGGQMSDEDAALMRDLGFTVYEFTINRVDKAQNELQRGIAGFYTDYLSPQDLAG